MSFWRAALSIVAKDVTADLRSRETLSALLVFALLVVLVFSFALELRVDNARQLAPGVLWVAFAFAGILGLNRSFIVEREESCISGLMLAPVDRSAIYVGKFLGNTLFMCTAEALVLPAVAVLFDVPALNPGLWLVILLGTVGFAAIGTTLAAIAVSTRAREVMLPILLLPITIPVLIAASKATGLVLDGKSLAEAGNWLRLLVAADVFFVTVSCLGFEYVLEE